VNTKPISALVLVMQKFREKQPGIFYSGTIWHLPGLYTYIAKCDTPDCTYKHDSPSGLGAAKTNAVVMKMEKAISSYLARNAS